MAKKIRSLELYNSAAERLHDVTSDLHNPFVISSFLFFQGSQITESRNLLTWSWQRSGAYEFVFGYESNNLKVRILKNKIFYIAAGGIKNLFEGSFEANDKRTMINFYSYGWFTFRLIFFLSVSFIVYKHSPILFHSKRTIFFGSLCIPLLRGWGLQGRNRKYNIENKKINSKIEFKIKLEAWSGTCQRLWKIERSIRD